MELKILLCLAQALFIRTVLAAALSPVSSPHFRLDVHSHVVPDFYQEALSQGGYPVVNGTVYVNGFPVPSWSLDTHITDMDVNQVNYSTLSLSAPGVSFLAGDETAAAQLARQLNLAMHNYTQQHPTRLGAMCALPLPHIDAAIEEGKVRKTCPHSCPFNSKGYDRHFNHELTL